MKRANSDTKSWMKRSPPTRGRGLKRVERDPDGNIQRALMAEGDGVWLAKDRSGRLAAWETPDLGRVISKISGTNGGEEEDE